ncbi:MAG: L-rhamnose/proton symporter RhaT [Thermoguttaceae bacterium]
MDAMTLTVGFAYLLLGALCGGSFGLPSKYAPKGTPWEVLWGPFFLLITVVMPFALGPVLVKDFFAIFAAAGPAALVLPLVFGFLWGTGSMTLGLSFSTIGLSLAYSLNYGAQIVFGALAPMAVFHPDRILTAQGAVILTGVAVCVAGVIVAGRAAMLKERSLQTASGDPASSAAGNQRMAFGVVLAIASGCLCACYILAAGFAGTIGKLAQEEFGNEPWRVSCAVAAVVLWGGSVSSCLYCLGQLTKNKTWTHFAAPGCGRVLLVALAMAFLHNGALFFLNLGFPLLGTLGESVGYASFMSFAIIVGNLHGFRTGEWKGASRQSIGWIMAGIAVLILGVCVLGAGNAIGVK